MASYIFTLRQELFPETGLFTDAFLDVSKYVGMDERVFKMAQRSKDTKFPEFDALKSMDIRIRFNNDISGPYLIHCGDTEMSRDDIEDYVNNLPKEKLLEFLKKAKI